MIWKLIEFCEMDFRNQVFTQKLEPYEKDMSTLTLGNNIFSLSKIKKNC